MNAQRNTLSPLEAKRHVWKGIGRLFYHPSSPARVISEHDHDRHALFISLSGNTWLNMPTNGYDRLQKVQPGGIAITPAHVTHSALVDPQAEFVLLYLQPEFMPESQERSQPNGLKPAIVASDPLIQSIGTTLASMSAEIIDSLYIESLFQALSFHLLNRYSLSPRSQFEQGDRPLGLSTRHCKQVCDYIDTHLHESIQLTDLAALTSFSRHYFSRLFKLSMGTSPYQYILQQRIKKAQHLLQSSDLSLVDIALTSGFANQSHFSQKFRQHVGVPPHQYRRQSH